eukprot:s1338_g1.t1
MCWEQMLSEVACARCFKLLAWLKDSLLRWQGQWSALWQAGLASGSETDVKFQWDTWSIRKFYALPTDIPAQQIDESTHGACFSLLTAANEDAAWEALSSLGCVREDERFAEGRRLQLTTFRMKDGCKALCVCRCFALIGECPHTNLVIYLNGDPSIPPLAPLSALTVKDALALQDADVELREEKKSGRPMKLPKQSAWLTLTELRQRLEKRQEIVKQSRTEERRRQQGSSQAGLSRLCQDFHCFGHVGLVQAHQRRRKAAWPTACGSRAPWNSPLHMYEGSRTPSLTHVRVISDASQRKKGDS